jgi:hypothetical protein
MEWEKLGLLWAPNGQPEWASSHATLPVVQTLSNDQWRVFLSTRDALGKSRIGQLTVDVRGERPCVVEFASQPVLSLGAPGTFDDSGVMPSWLVDAGGRQYLYYVGWNVLATVPYRQAIGLAVSDDDGATFQRYSQGPVIDRGVKEPFFATSPCVHIDGGVWRMWYVSCTGWERIADRWEPAYHVKYAESRDGIAWDVTGISCLDAGPGFAVARPCVFRQGGKYAMLYPVRSLVDYRTNPEAAYNLGYAESDDGIKWTRMDASVGIARSIDGWDSEMLAYCWLQRRGKDTFLLYNGNGFGKTGVGVARLVERAVEAPASR